MRSKSLLIAASFVALATLAAIFVRIQPAGCAMVFRRAQSIAVRSQRIYFRPFFSADRCCTRISDGRLEFERAVIAISTTADEVPLHVRFLYDPPASVPADWRRGDWCGSLLARVTASASTASRAETAEALLADRRAAGDRIAAGIERELTRAGVHIDAVSVRVDLPPGFERLRNVSELSRQSRAAPPVIFVGLDGADWQLLDEYIANGSMPNLGRLVKTGVGGILETDYPPLSPLVWTTMMTGAGPLDHAILDFTRFNPFTHEKEPITSDERRAPAVWNMLTSAGKRTAVFGLWATYAAEPVHGLNVSDRLFTFLYSDTQKPAGVVWPPSRQAWTEHTLADAEGNIDVRRMREYLPSLTDDEFAALSKRENPYSDPAAALRRILVETEVYDRLASAYLHGLTPLPDLTIIYLQGTDTIGHVFAPFAPPKQPQASQSDYDRYNAVPARYFRDIDALLGRYAEIAERNGATMMIASDHGFFWREGRPTQISSTATATAAKWHRKEGMYVIRGPGIAAVPGHPLRGSVRQVCATLLTLTGMPALPNAAPALPGAPPPSAPFDYGRIFIRAAPPPPPSAGHAGSEEIAKLKALGYIGSTESTHATSGTTDTKTAGAFNNEGLILRNEHRANEALAAFEKAQALDPRYASAMWNESETLFNAGRDLDRADDLLIRALQNGMADAAGYVITRSIAYEKQQRGDRSLRLLNAAVGVSANDPELRMFRGRYRMDAHDCANALDDFRAAQVGRPNDPLAYASAALAQMCLGDDAAARASIERSLQLDPNQPMLQKMLRP